MTSSPVSSLAVPAVDLSVYGDFTDPYSYLASRRVDVLQRNGAHVSWCAVRGRTDVPVTGVRCDAERSCLSEGVESLRALLLPGEGIPAQVPALLPHSEAAVSAYAEAVGAGIADEVRRLLFELYWVDGIDIGAPNVLRTPLAGAFKRGHGGVDAVDYAGFAVATDRGPISTDAWRRIAAWREGWREVGLRTLPVLMLADGSVLQGTDALRRLGKEIAAHDLPLDLHLADARRYPAVTVQPGPHWSSQHGGRYLNRFRPRAA